MGTGTYLMKRLGEDLSARYGISFSEYLRRGYHLFTYEDDILADIQRIKTEWEESSYVELSKEQCALIGALGFECIEMDEESGGECDECDRITNRFWKIYDYEYPSEGSKYLCDKCVLEFAVNARKDIVFGDLHCDKCETYIQNNPDSDDACWGGICGANKNENCDKLERFHIPEEDLLRIFGKDEVKLCR